MISPWEIPSHPPKRTSGTPHGRDAQEQAAEGEREERRGEEREGEREEEREEAPCPPCAGTAGLDEHATHIPRRTCMAVCTMVVLPSVWLRHWNNGLAACVLCVEMLLLWALPQQAGVAGVPDAGVPDVREQRAEASRPSICVRRQAQEVSERYGRCQLREHKAA